MSSTKALAIRTARLPYLSHEIAQNGRATSCPTFWIAFKLSVLVLEIAEMDQDSTYSPSSDALGLLKVAFQVSSDCKPFIMEPS